MIHAEIIAIGTELTTGAKLDTNSQWLSTELAAVGIPVRYHTTVADDLDANVAVLKIAAERADVVLITGGLGPTLDDLTRQAMADLIGVQLELHEPSLEAIREMFSSRGRAMPARNIVQAMFPQGSEPIPNPRGTAPGVWMEVPRGEGRAACRMAAMPGVPSEMKWMFTNFVLPRLLGAGAGGIVIRSARLNCFGLGESQAEEMLGDLTARGRDPEVGITVHEATITLRIQAHGQTALECENKIAAARHIAYERLGHTIFGEGDEELQDVVVRLLNERGATLSTAESATGGLLAYRLTEVPGSSTCFLGGTVALSNAAKDDWLGVNVGWLEEVGTCSAEVAEAMATTCRRRFGSDYGLAVTDLAASGKDSAAAAPCVFIALATPETVITRQLQPVGDVTILKSRTAKAALNLVRLHLLKIDVPE